jgi:spore coat protein CotH
VAAAAPASAATPAPAWNLRLIPMTTNFAPGSQGNTNIGPRFNVLATNVGGATATGPIVFTDMEMQGGKKGLLENSRNLCSSVNRVGVQMVGQNGKSYDTTPALKVKCPKGKKGKKRHRRSGR